jgi:formate hydrogenlyase subunit 4
MNLLYGLIYLIVAPVIGGIAIGIDRKITARMQSRVGPPILQPFYDVLKLFEKENIVVTRPQNFFVFAYIAFMALTGVMFFSGGDLLLVIFAMTLAEVFLVLGAYSANSPYSFLGAERELIQIMAFEPMILLSAAGMYIATGGFLVSSIAVTAKPLILLLPGIFIGLLYVLTIKLRKSPFDLSAAQHTHQELVQGVMTEFSGSTLGGIEIARWYEIILMMGFVYLFFGFSPLLAIIAVILTYLFQLFMDNTYPRFKWNLALKSSWAAALVLGMTNILVLWFYFKGGL